MEVHAEPSRRAHPGGWKQHRNSVLLEPRQHVAEEGADLVGSELRDGRLGRVELDPRLGQQGLEGVELPDQVARRVARADEREDPGAAVPEARGRQGERRVVFCLQPQLEHERAGGALVQAQLQLPRRRRAPVEAAADPAGQLTLERGVAGVRREACLGGGQAVEEELERAPAPVRGGRGQPHARLAQPVAGELVDDHRVEVEHRGLRVAVERAGAGRRHRRRDRAQRRLHVSVERRAPEGRPGAVLVDEARMDEPFAERPVRQGDDREGRPSALAEGEACRRSRGKTDQLGDLHAAHRELASEERDLGDRGSAHRQVRGGELALRSAREDVRARVLLPDQLQRRRRQDLGGDGRRVRGHEPSNIGADRDAPRPPVEAPDIDLTGSATPSTG